VLTVGEPSGPIGCSAHPDGATRSPHDDPHLIVSSFPGHTVTLQRRRRHEEGFER
jgi:hypothetical protein